MAGARQEKRDGVIPFLIQPMTAESLADSFSIRASTTENAISIEQLDGKYGINLDSMTRYLEATGFGYIAYSQERGAGFCMANQATGEINVLAVRPEFEKMGLGKQLLNRCVNQLMEGGHYAPWLLSNPDAAVRAHGFYRHLGWLPTGEQVRDDEVLELQTAARPAWQIRPQADPDLEAVLSLNSEAFGGDDEARIVSELQQHDDALISLVAELDQQIIGHILFSPVTAESDRECSLWGLAPMSVKPALQVRGVGKSLIHAGLAACVRQGGDGVVVLGHPRYYPKFGFQPASRFGLGCQWDVPDEAFMALELSPTGFESVNGLVSYHPVLGGSD